MEKRLVTMAEVYRGPWFYRCLLNPAAPLLQGGSYQEHREMLRNGEYQWVGEDGVPLTTQEMIDREQAEQRIPLR